MAILTPESHPDHDVVGRYFKGFGVIWYCDSYDTSMGFWMTPVFGEKHAFLDKKPERTNVSERAIHRTIWTIHRYDYDDKTTFHCQHVLEPEERKFLKTVNVR